MRAFVLLLWTGLAGCSLVNSEKRQDRPLLPDVEAYFEATLNGQPWQPDTAYARWDTFVDTTGQRFFRLVLSAVIHAPTPELPYYFAYMGFELCKKDIQAGITYMLYRNDCYKRIIEDENGYLYSEAGDLIESEGDVLLSSFLIERSDSSNNWVHFFEIKPLGTEYYVVEGTFNLKLSPLLHDPVWSRYPKDTLTFTGRFRLLATSPR